MSRHDAVGALPPGVVRLSVPCWTAYSGWDYSHYLTRADAAACKYATGRIVQADRPCYTATAVCGWPLPVDADHERGIGHYERLDDVLDALDDDEWIWDGDKLLCPARRGCTTCHGPDARIPYLPASRTEVAR